MPDPVPLTALIVDDDIDMRLLIRLVLEASRHGIDVVGDAVDGADAIASIVVLDPPPVPTVVVLDNRMPGLSGLEVAAQVRQRGEYPRIILFSAFLTPELRAQAKEIGIDACLGKTDVDQLPDLIMKLTAPS